MVSYKSAINEVLKALVDNADYLQVSQKNIRRNVSVDWKPPFIGIVPTRVTMADTESMLGEVGLSIFVSVPSNKDIYVMNDDAMDLQARILTALMKANVDFNWLGSDFAHLEEKNILSDNPLLEIFISIFYNPTKETL